MQSINRKTELKFENLLSLKGKIRQSDIPDEMMKIGKYLRKKGIRKKGPIITTTFDMEMVDEEPILDMEILVPLNKHLELDEGYKLKKTFNLVNAVSIRHEGDPNQLQDAYNRLLSYIETNRLQRITPVYNVYVNDLTAEQSLEEMIIDVYIGINPSIL